MDLLKEGVKSLSRQLNSSMDMNSMDMKISTVPSTSKTKQERNSKQMVLSSKLELLGMNEAIKVSRLFVKFISYLYMLDENLIILSLN